MAGCVVRMPVVLPTCCYVTKHYLYVRFELLQKSKKEQTFPEVTSIVLRDIKTVWDKACLPCLSERRIFQMLEDYFDKSATSKKKFIGGMDVATSGSLRRRVPRINRMEEIKSKAYSKLILGSANVNDPDIKKSGQ
nr:unnamed protein product [Callosobruchus analis]